LGETDLIHGEERELKRMGKRGLLSLMAAGSMLTAIGCEAVGGVDVNQAVVAMYDVKSMESSATVEWEFKGNPSGGAEAAKVAAALGAGRIVIDELLQEDTQTMSAIGAIELSKGDIPFALYIEGQTMVLDIEGTKQPFELDFAALAGANASAGMPFDSSMLSDTLAQEAGQQLLKDIVSYFLGHMTNPEDTTVGTVSETIDGASKTLTKVSAKADFEELVVLASGALASIAADEEGLKALISSLYETLKPIIAESMGGAEDPVLKNMLNNKTLMVELIYSQIAPLLQTASEDLNAMTAEEMPFSANSGVTAELLLDGVQPAGLNLELYAEPTEGEGDGLESVRLAFETRWWNVNGDVDAKSYDGATAPFPIDAKPRQRLANIEPQSLLYDILKNDLKVTRHSFDMYMGANASVPDGISPYIKGAGTTMVPVRYVSEQLDATVDWNGAAQSITIKDAEAGIEIVMKIGDRKATVNGAAQTLPEAPELVEGATFVPIAFITKALGGAASWNGELGIVTIEKEF